MSNNIIASSPNIQWNISNCEIQDIVINNTQSPLKFKVEQTHQVINKCDNSIISEYKVSDINWNYWVIIILLSIILVLRWLYKLLKD